MTYNGEEYTAPNGTYQIRSYDGAKAIYTTIGDDLDEAEATLARLLEKMQYDTLNANLVSSLRLSRNPRRPSSNCRKHSSKSGR